MAMCDQKFLPEEYQRNFHWSIFLVRHILLRIEKLLKILAPLVLKYKYCAFKNTNTHAWIQVWLQFQLNFSGP